jgi:hypothetical protein
MSLASHTITDGDQQRLIFEKFRVYRHVTILRRLLAAEPEVFSEQHCSRMRARLASVITVG